jgi:tetratricopeptide (TPR) repeat protein
VVYSTGGATFQVSTKFSITSLFEYNQGNYDEALDYMNKAIKLDPYNAQAYSNRGVIYFRKKDYSQAVTDFNRAIDIAPKYTHAYFIRGYAYSKIGNIERANIDWKTAAKLGHKEARDLLKKRGIDW